MKTRLLGNEEEREKMHDDTKEQICKENNKFVEKRNEK